jgi:hypothetical protein
MADTTAGVQVFVGPANQLELGTVTEGPTQVTLETISNSKQRINFRISAPTTAVLNAAEAAQVAASQAALNADSAKVAANQAAAQAAIAATAPTDAQVQTSVDAKVPPAVTSALASDSVAKNAAAAAVAGKLTEAGVMKGAQQILSDDTIAFAVTGAENRRSWIEVANNGRPTVHAAKLVADAVAPAVDAQIEAKPVPKRTHDGVETAFVVTDLQGRRSWIEIGADGKPTGRAASMIDAAMGALTDARMQAKVNTLPLPQTITEGPGLAYVFVDNQGRKSELQIGLDGKFSGPFPARILRAAVDAATAAATGTVQYSRVPLVGWGDSMTAANWLALTASILNVPYKQYGIGGQGIESIAARQNAIPALVTLPGNMIPASGTVTLTSISTVIYSSPSSIGISSGHGTINGVPGTLSRDNTNNLHTFARDTPGDPVWTAPNTPFMSDNGVATRSNISIFWTGRNSFSNRTPEQIVAHISASVDYLTASEKRFLVLEIAPWVGEENGTPNRVKLDAANAAILAAFPRDFVPLMTYLRSDQAFADAGIAKTDQDVTDIANGLTPTSFRGDGGHLNTLGNNTIAKYIAKVIQQKGWTLT